LPLYCHFCIGRFSIAFLLRLGLAACGEDFDAHVAAGFFPFVVLFGEDGADQPDDGGAVGEDPDDVGSPADLFVEALLWVIAPDLAPDLAGKAVNARISSRASSRAPSVPRL
jgi:hypothetical protein